MNGTQDYSRVMCTVTITGVHGAKRAFYKPFDECAMLFAEIITSPGMFPEPMKEVRLREPNPENGNMVTTLVYRFP